MPDNIWQDLPEDVWQDLPEDVWQDLEFVSSAVVPYNQHKKGLLLHVY
jgi:hypothetical protein